MTTPDLPSLITNLTSGDDEVAENAANEITALGESTLPTLFELLDSADQEARWWALRTLSGIPHQTVQWHLRNFLSDPNPELRKCAALGLREQPWSEATRELTKILGDEDRLLSRVAADTLITFGSQVIPDLINILEKGTPAAQIEAARALALIGDTSAIAAMFNAWQDGSTMIRFWVEEGFERMGIGMQFFRPK